MEELFLRGFLAGDELNIVDEECVGLAVLFAETHGGTGADGLDQLVCKLVALDINDILIREILFELVTDGVEQVRFAEAGVAVDKEGIVVFARFEWGLTADVQPPDFETRMAIIKRKAELVGLSVPDNVCEFIAQKLKSNIRQLEGTVKKLNAIHLVEGATPTISTAQRAISDIVNNEQPAPVTVSKIIEEVGRTYGVSPEDIKSSKRNANVSFARQISMYVVREITQMPMVEIGKEFGGRDHSTVVYAIQQIEEKSARDPVTKATVSDIIKNIRDR